MYTIKLSFPLRQPLIDEYTGIYERIGKDLEMRNILNDLYFLSDFFVQVPSTKPISTVRLENFNQRRMRSSVSLLQSNFKAA